MRREVRKKLKAEWEEKNKYNKPYIEEYNRQKYVRDRAIALAETQKQEYEKALSQQEENKYKAYEKLAKAEINYEEYLIPMIVYTPCLLFLLAFILNPTVFNLAFIVIGFIIFRNAQAEYKDYIGSFVFVEAAKTESDITHKLFRDWTENLNIHKSRWGKFVLELLLIPSIAIIILLITYNIFPKIQSYTQIFACLLFLGLILQGFKAIYDKLKELWLSLMDGKLKEAFENINNYVGWETVFDNLITFAFASFYYIIVKPIKLIAKILFILIIFFWSPALSFFGFYWGFLYIKEKIENRLYLNFSLDFLEFVTEIVLLFLSSAFFFHALYSMPKEALGIHGNDFANFCRNSLPFITVSISLFFYLLAYVSFTGIVLYYRKLAIKEKAEFKKSWEALNETIKPSIPIEIPKITLSTPNIIEEWEEYKRKEYDKGPHGSARFADFDDLEDHGLLIHSPNPPNDLFLAKLDKFHGYQEWISIDAKKGHLLTIAPSGKGKGVHTVIPNLLTYNGSVVCLDIKGENAIVTGRTRTNFGEVFTLNPWKLHNLPNTKFNPMDMLKEKSQEYQTDIADILSRKIVYSVKGDEDHWITSARSLVKAMILYVANAEKFEGERHLPKVLDLLSDNQSGLNDTFLDMQSYSGINPVISRQGSTMLGRSDSDRSGIISTAVEQLEFLNDLQLSDSMKNTSNNFNLQAIKQQITSIYLSIPPSKLSTGHKWLRIIIGCLFFELTSSQAGNLKKPVLFLLDEFPVLGYMSEIKEAYAIMRGYNVCFWAIIQDLSQLKSTYGEAYETFIANANVLQFFGTQDHITAKYISDISGEATIEYLTYTKTAGFSDTEGSGKSKTISYSTSYSESVSETTGSSFTSGGSPHGGSSSSTSDSISSTKGSSRSDSSSNTDSTNESHTKSASEGITKNLQKRQLLVIDDVLRMTNDKQILRIGEMPVCISPKLAYFKDDHFRPLADTHPSFNH